MPPKLLTLSELSNYLGIKEEKIISLVEKKVISAYKIGGELLRFRREQIEAIRAEIETLVTDEDKIVISETRRRVKERIAGRRSMGGSSLMDKISDFFYFYDFYIATFIISVVLIIAIIRG